MIISSCGEVELGAVSCAFGVCGGIVEVVCNNESNGLSGGISPKSQNFGTGPLADIIVFTKSSMVPSGKTDGMENRNIFGSRARLSSIVSGSFARGNWSRIAISE